MLVMQMKDRLKEAIDASRLPVPEVAKRLKVSRSAVYQWLAGDTKNLKLENLFAVAEMTGYSAKWLATGQGTKREAKLFAPDLAGLDLSFLTITLQAVEKYLNEAELSLDPEAKAKLITLLYEICAEKGKVEQPAVARYLRLVA